MARKSVNSKNISKNKIFFNQLKEISEFRKIDIQTIMKILEDSFIKTITKNLDPDAEIELIVDYENENIRLVNKTALVVSDETYNEDIAADEGLKTCEISISQAKQLFAHKVQEDEKVSIDIDFETLPKNIFSPVQQQFKQKIAELVREAVYQKYSTLKGKVVKAKLISKLRAGYLYEIEDDQVHAFMPKHLATNSKKKNELGLSEDVYIEDVLEEVKDTQIIISNSSNNILKDLIEKEIPEIAAGEIEIFRIARHAGERSKVAIKSTSGTVINNVGALVGKSGSRIELIVNELGEEKVDIIEYSEDLNQFIVNALAPTRIVSVLPFKSKKLNKIVVVVPDSQHSLAIGKKGINVTLASELTRSRIDIYSYSKALNDGFKLNWNGNISSESELETIENEFKNRTSANAKIKKAPYTTNKTRNSKSKINPNYLLDEFDKDIQKYNEDFGLNISEETANSEQKVEKNDSTSKSSTKVEKDSVVKNNRKANVNKFDGDSIFDNAFSDFQDNIDNNKPKTEELYTKEDLKQISEEIKNYKMDNDLAEFAGLNDFDFDINDADWDDEENE
ncbi:transcription termination factor NusA [Mycoplasma sp. 480]|uniref:transcription termination factor NusA n=1 Tax=Mycoplasma sp. 480 TaxID=3440155 RepID=UPI003F516987